MSSQSFSLIPFPAPAIPDIKITGTILRQNNLLALHYSLTGTLEEVILPSQSTHPGRKDELWKMTCFEFFVAIKDQPGYWEFNMSPSGDWNVYRMDAYRRVGFREETSIQGLQLDSQREHGLVCLNVVADLSPIINYDQFLEIGSTAVIQTKDGNETYWALTHPAPLADFHLRESFILGLAAQTHPLEQSALGA